LFCFKAKRNKRFSLCFRLISFSFCFRCKNKRKTLFSHRSEKILHPFRFEAKLMAVFASFSFCFRFVPILFRFRFLRFASMRNKRKKNFFSHRSETNFASVSLHFASKRK
jgi:hypothetical protein